jgi:hypothetical protein
MGLWSEYQKKSAGDCGFLEFVCCTIAWLEGATESDIHAIKNAMEKRPSARFPMQQQIA